MRLLQATLITLAAAALACGSSSSGTSSAAFDAATPSYAQLSMDQLSSDTSTASVNGTGALTTTTIQGSSCAPHLFERQREVVRRVNRHIYKALRHVEAALAKNPVDATNTSKVWEVVEDGLDRKFTISYVSPNVYSWELDVGAVGTSPLPVVMTGQIDRTGATGPHQGKGNLHVDFSKLHAGDDAEVVMQGTLDVQFDVSATARTLTVTATNIDWQLDAGDFESAGDVTALSTPRSGSYVYTREAGKGGSLKIQDEMVYDCPANPSFLPSTTQLVSRWYVATDGTIHGRSDALMQGGSLPSTVDHLAAVTCDGGAPEGDMESEGFWLIKAEDASGNTLSGYSSTSVDPTLQACDPIFGVVPDLTDKQNDFTGWPTSYTDGVPFPFPNM